MGVCLGRGRGLFCASFVQSAWTINFPFRRAGEREGVVGYQMPKKEKSYNSMI